MEFYIDISRSGEIKSKFQEIIKELGGYEKKLLRVSKEIGKISGFEEMEQKVAALHEELVSERKSVEELLDIYLKCVQCYKDTEEKLVSSDIFDGHMLLDIGGLIPGIGMACDGINAGWYASEGDWSNALLSGLSFLPAIGEISGIGKVGAKIISHADDAADIVKAADKVGDVAKAADDAADIFKGLNGVKKGATSAKGLVGHDFEDYVSDMIGGEGSFSVDGRDFDGGVGSRWWEAKSGNYWSMLEENPAKMAKFKSDMGDRLRIANENGATYELFSNTPIPETIKQWLAKKGIPFTEL